MTRMCRRVCSVLLSILIDDGRLSDDDYAELAVLMRWFRLHLNGPFEHRLRKPWRARRSICWFKSEAHEHVKQARRLANVLERNDVAVQMIKSHNVAYIIYEDSAQVLAQPSADVRRLL